MGLAAAVMGDVANGGDYSLIERFADLDRQIWDAKGWIVCMAVRST